VGRRAFAHPGAVRHAVVRLDPSPNSPATALAEIYNVPQPGFGPRGTDIDSQDVVWARQRLSRQLRPAQM
jgi:hypothetical protein